MRPVGARQQPGASLRDCFATCAKLLFPENRSDRRDQHQSDNHGRKLADARCHSLDPTVQHKRFHPRSWVGIAFRWSHCSRLPRYSSSQYRSKRCPSRRTKNVGQCPAQALRSLTSATTCARLLEKSAFRIERKSPSPVSTTAIQSCSADLSIVSGNSTGHQSARR
jgi:hypothetical protein